jgi:hypothetical protein
MLVLVYGFPLRQCAPRIGPGSRLMVPSEMLCRICCQSVPHIQFSDLRLDKIQKNAGQT